jgi:hypothetical protein
MRTVDLLRRIAKLEMASKPEQQRVIIARLMDSPQSLQELPTEPAEWLTYPAAEKRSWSASGVKVVYLDTQAERAARAAASAL